MESDDETDGSGCEAVRRRDIRAIRYRLANDFQLAIITLLGTIASLGITPFALLRAINGQWLALAVDLFILVGILGSMIRAWCSGDTHFPSLFLAYFIGTMAVVAAYVLGTTGKYWFYPAIVANFFLVDRRHALAIAVFGLLVVVLGGGAGQLGADAASYSVTVVVCALLSYAFAYRTAIQRSQLENLATKDALTGAFNRHTLLEELERARRAFARERRGYGILVLDMDHFKRINDRHGHQAGDRVLVELARLLEQNIRHEDRLFRYGGEEFVILAQCAALENLRAMGEQLRRKIEQRLRDPDGQPLTTSVGGALLCPDESADEWFARADTALYVTKNAGRNQVFIDPGGDASSRG